MKDPDARPTDGRELLVSDLLLSFERSCALLAREVAQARWLDAFLLAAGALQILEDHLHADVGSFGRAASYLAETDDELARRAARGVRLVADTTVALTDRRASIRGLTEHRDLLVGLTIALADIVIMVHDVPDEIAHGLGVQAKAVASAALLCSPRLRTSLMRLPSCFRSFDQRPQDIVELAARFAKRWPDRARPVAVVGLRTSGSYLGPLAIAALAQQGYGELHHLSVRPEAFFRADERRELVDVAASGGLVVLVDDPPTTGSSLAAAAALVERCAVPRHAIVIALCVFADDHALPAPLAGYEALTVTWEDWRVHTEFEPPVVAESVRGLLPDHVELVGLDAIRVGFENGVREHRRRSFAMHLHDHRTGAHRRQVLIVEGTGLGFFGRHALAIARSLPDRTPQVLGFREGLLYTMLDAAGAVEPGKLARDIGNYVATRERALPTPLDRGHHLSGRQPVWEVAANQLCRTFGRAGVALRMPLVDPIVRRLTTTPTPSIVDGRMDLDRWVETGAGRLSAKLEFAEGAFSHRDLFCYDAVFDLVGAAVAADDDAFGAAARAEYERASGTSVDHERWLIYSLVHYWDRQRRGMALPGSDHCRAMSRAMQRYFASQYLADLRVDTTGEVVALDLDGTLESSPLGFPATTERGAMAVRALVAHGYRPVLATGRALGDVQDRCDTYGLCGGVAEYGTVVYDATTRTVVDLLSDDERASLVSARVELSRLPGVELDPGHTHSIRAFRRRGGNAIGLEAATVDAFVRAMATSAPMTPVPGMGQTDFVPIRHTKASGLTALLERLGPANGGRLASVALAVGDGVADLAMFRLAERAVAPANAAPNVRSSGSCTIARGGYQVGLAQAVASLVGHEPGRCGRCARPPMRPRARRLVDLLSIQEGGGRGMPVRLVRFAIKALRRPGDLG